MTTARVLALIVAFVLAALQWTVAAGATTRSSTVTVTAGKPTEFGFTLSTKSVKVGTVTFKITNKGVIGHTFKVCSSSKGGAANACAGKVTGTIAGGKSATLKVVFAKKGTYEYLCTVPGHAAGGMKGDLKVS